MSNTQTILERFEPVITKQQNLAADEEINLFLMKKQWKEEYINEQKNIKIQTFLCNLVIVLTQLSVIVKLIKSLDINILSIYFRIQDEKNIEIMLKIPESDLCDEKFLQVPLLAGSFEFSKDIKFQVHYGWVPDSQYFDENLVIADGYFKAEI